MLRKMVKTDAERALELAGWKQRSYFRRWRNPNPPHAYVTLQEACDEAGIILIECSKEVGENE